MAALIDRAAVHERHSPVGEHKFLRLREGESDTFGLMLRAAGELVAYGHATHFPPLPSTPERVAVELVVDPEHRGQGFGRALLDRVMDEARSTGAARLDLWGHHADAGCSALAESAGMQVSRALWQLSLILASVPQRFRSDPLPDGVRVRGFADGDEDAVVELVRAAFPEHPENGTWTREDFDGRADQPWFDASALLLAETTEDGGRLVGLHWMKLEPESTNGEVYMLGVAPETQGHGLGRTLLLLGLEEMRRRGVTLAFLYVEAENEAAMRLYRQAGFRHEHLDTCYSLDLEAAAAVDG